jgi:hypothetical protein
MKNEESTTSRIARLHEQNPLAASELIQLFLNRHHHPFGNTIDDMREFGLVNEKGECEESVRRILEPIDRALGVDVDDEKVSSDDHVLRISVF